jgi:hypothetical protein
MSSFEPKEKFKAMWLGPQEDKAQVLAALKQHHAFHVLPIQIDAGVQHIADHVRRKLEGEELAAFPEKIMSWVRQSGRFSDVAATLLASVEQGGDVWEWGIDPHVKPNGGYSYSYGWCVVRDGQVVASLCHSTS